MAVSRGSCHGESFGAHIYPIKCSLCHLMLSHVHPYPQRPPANVATLPAPINCTYSRSKWAVRSGRTNKKILLFKHFFLFQIFRQGGNAWNLFDSDNQSAAIFCVDTIKYNSLPSVPSGLETRPDGWQTARHFKMSRGKCTYYYNCCSAHASIRSTGGTWYHGMYYRLSKHFLLLIILPSENIRHTWYMIFQCKLAW